VDVSFPVTPGIQYKLSELEIGGYRAFPEEPLHNLIHLKRGEPANAVQLENDLRAVQKLYGTKGYLTAQVRAEPTMDDTSATVRYHLEVIEGDQYHMGDLKIDGLPEDATERVTRQWQIKMGDAYDESYITRFLGSPFTDANLQRRYSVVPKQEVDSQSKTVTVFLHFVPKN
jgi:outer membrane protein insertion porin family